MIIASESRHLARCRVCRDEGPALAADLRGLEARELTVSEQDRLWQGIRAGIEAKRARRIPAIFSWLRGLRRRRPVLAWAPAVVAAMLLALSPLLVGPDERVVSQARLEVGTTIEHVEAGPAVSVLVLETPTQRLPIIWVLESDPSKPGS